MADTREQKAAYIAALLRERAGREIAEDQEAMEAIDAELRRVGHKARKPSERAEKRPARKGTQR